MFCRFLMFLYFCIPQPDKWEVTQEKQAHLFCTPHVLNVHQINFTEMTTASKLLGRDLNSRLPDSKSHAFAPTLHFPGFLRPQRGHKCLLVIQSRLEVIQRLQIPWIPTYFIVIWFVLSEEIAPFRMGLPGYETEQLRLLFSIPPLFWLAWCEEGSSFWSSSRSTPTLLKRRENW